MSPENSVMQQFEAFAKILEPDLSSAEQLQVTAAVVDLLRHPLPPNGAAAVAQLLLELPTVPWANLKFSLIAAIQDAKYTELARAAGAPANKIPGVLLQSIIVLLDFLQGGAEVSEDIFAAIVASAAEAAATQPVRAANSAPELVTDAVMRRAFSPAVVDAQKFLAWHVEPVLYRGELPRNELSPDIRGIAFTAVDGQKHVLLETGEYLPTTANAITVASMLPADIANFPATLAAVVTVATPAITACGALEKSAADQLAAGPLGAIMGPHKAVIPSAAAMAAIEQVFSTGRDALNMGATGPSGATARFPVPSTDLAVVVDARFSARGPYATSRLVRECGGDDVVLMRNDTLRLFTSRGVYLFPTPHDGLISLTNI